MTTSVADMEILKEIPGYKAIMKAVLKTQIQLLVEQLSDHTGEESVVLTASVNDGSLSHLGSSTGKGFLEGRDEIKSQFLGYCLKSHHKRKTQESPAPYQRSNVSHPGPRSSGQQSAKRPRLHPVSLSRISADSEVPVMLPDQRSTDTSGEAVYTSTPARSQRGSISESLSGPPRTLSSDSATNIKLEQSSGMLENDDTGQQRDTGTDFMTPASLPSSIGLSHTQTTESVSQRDSEKDKTHIEGESGQDSPNIKVEPEGESELDLEITGIELGDSTSQGSSENWGQNVSSGAVGYETGASGDSSFQQSENQAGYKMDQENDKEDSGEAEGLKTVESDDPDNPHMYLVPSVSLSNPNLDLSVNPLRHAGMPMFPDLSVNPPQQAGTPSFQELMGDADVYRELVKVDEKEFVIYRCPFCLGKYPNKSLFTRHMRVHTGEKPFECFLCGRKFARKEHLKRHVTSLRPHK